MASEAKKAYANLGNAALFFFALVGCLASFTTLSSYYYGTPHSALSVKVVAGKLLIPQYVTAKLSDDSSTRKLGRDLKTVLCAGIDSNKLINLSDEELDKLTIAKKTPEQIRKCRDAHEIDFTLRWSNSFSKIDGAIVDYEIENVGSDIAKGIRLSANDVNTAQIKRQSDSVEIKKEEGEDYFNLPDLNPHEKIEVIAWVNTEGMINHPEFPDESSIPTITYSGSIVVVHNYHPVSGIVWELWSGFHDIPMFIILLAIILASLLISGVCVVVVSVMVSIMKGRGLAGVFSTPKTDLDPLLVIE